MSLLKPHFVSNAATVTNIIGGAEVEVSAALGGSHSGQTVGWAGLPFSAGIQANSNHFVIFFPVQNLTC